MAEGELAEGAVDVPGPVPIVSPVVPLFNAPLLMPVPWVARSAAAEPAPTGLDVAGDTAESPDVVVVPVLAFCATAAEIVSRRVDTAAIKAVFFMLDPSVMFALKAFR
jgi:hypothetical protein